jgi:hypothetical protein
VAVAGDGDGDGGGVERKGFMSWVGRSLLVAVMVVGCKDEPAEPEHEHAHDASTEGDAAEFEGCPESTPAFALGMSTAGDEGRITVVLREASAVPPVRYFNDWALEFTDADGAPLDDVDVVRARAYMRVHNHYGTPDPKLAQREDEPAVFDFKRINLFMRGPWEVQLTLRSESAGEDNVVVHVCVDE